MFILTKFADLVQISPEDFSKQSAEAIRDNISLKYSNKVVQKIGLCICLFDLLWASEGLIGHGTGLVNVNVEFRLVVFRPFKEEIIQGRIRSSSPAGILIKTEFFDDILVPYDKLPVGAEYDPQQELWAWNYDGLRLFYDTHELVRFRVVDEEWNDQSPVGPSRPGLALPPPLKAPYRIMGSMAGDGLGVCLWWD